MAETQELAFFSYAREDSTFALKLAKDLKAAGLSIWIDQLDISPGQRWDRTVEEALASCPRMLVVLSPASVASNNVMDEVSYSLEEGKIVIPILHKDCKIPFRLRRVQYADFRSQYETGITDLVSTLHRTAALVKSQSAHPSVPDQIAVETPEIDTEIAKRADEERLQRARAEGAKRADEERLQRERAEAAKRADEERLQREKAEAAKRADEGRLQREKAEAAKRADEERLQRERAEAAKRADEEQKVPQPIARSDAQGPRILSLAEAFERAEAERDAKKAKGATRG